MPQDSGNIYKLKSHSQLDFKVNVFMQMNRCMILQTNGDSNFVHSVNALEDLLSPKLDDGYNDEMKKMEGSIDDKIWEAKELKKDSNKNTNEIQFELARKKLRALMNVADKNDYLPQKRNVWDSSNKKAIILEVKK